jgi:hypothetical protein
VRNKDCVEGKRVIFRPTDIRRYVNYNHPPNLGTTGVVLSPVQDSGLVNVQFDGVVAPHLVYPIDLEGISRAALIV